MDAITTSASTDSGIASGDSSVAVIGGRDGKPDRIRYTLPRYKRGDWIGPGRTKKATSPDAQGVVNLSPYELLDRLADLVPPPRKHLHRYHGVFAPAACLDTTRHQRRTQFPRHLPDLLGQAPRPHRRGVSAGVS